MLAILGVRKTEAMLLREALRFVIAGAFKRPLWSTRHFREWYFLPMNYARVMEVPIAFDMLAARSGDYILDVSSPKLLAVLLDRLAHAKVVAADISDYFVRDFSLFQRHLKIRAQTSVFDASGRIPFDDGTFDKVYSVSVVEHIPDDGHFAAMAQMARVLKQNGDLVVTVPVWRTPMEEWIDKTDGKVFFQRRYDKATFDQLVAASGCAVVSFTLIAERPISEPAIGKTGVLEHNSYLVERDRLSWLVSKVGRRLFIPFTRYWAERRISERCHYLTTDWSDPNIRQAAIHLRKA